MMAVLYTLAGLALTPLLHLWLARRAARGKEDPARKAERFGHATIARPMGKLIWLHAASVGEAQSVLTLVRALLARDSTVSLLITTGTVTSATLVAQQNLPRVIHQFVPVDTYPAIRRFLTHWKPDLVLWVESEFWPQCLLQAHARQIPILLINARVSARSFAGWKRWGGTIRRILRCFDTIFAGSAEDAARLRSLGAGQVMDAGNLKFDAAPLGIDEPALAALHAQIAHRPCWLAASTHANEEQLVGEAHRSLKHSFPELLTIIAPRHAARGERIAAELRQSGLTVARRSIGEPVTPQTDIYLADTMGELGTLYRAAPIAFIGGSLIAHGGHNPLEPARLGCAIICGPHTHNFTAMVQPMLQAGVVRAVADGHALAATVAELLQQPALANHMAQQAQRYVETTGGAMQAILTRIDALQAGG